MPYQVDNADDVPRLVADKLARRCWSVARDDLRQEAELAALHMRTLYNPEKGDLRGYLYRGLARHLTNYMWEQGSPVSYKHRRNLLRAATSVDVDKASGVADPHVNVDADVARSVWRGKVAERLLVLAGADAELVAPCLFDAGTPLAVAHTMGVPLLRVLDALTRVRELISEDEIMQQLYGDMP